MLKRLVLQFRTKLGLVGGTQRMKQRRISMPLVTKPDNISDELVLIHRRPKGFRRFVVI
ncbi:MAG TPA: hypothetical protein VKF36_01450 [Syntrophorhabdales bacterium]|nr:hypothetical protein [Syntrophorhabdales bacterium]